MATETKKRLTKNGIDEQVKNLVRACNRLPDDMKQGCLENVKDIKEKLEYLLDHSAEEFCKHIGACENNKLRAGYGQILHQLKVSSNNNHNLATNSDECQQCLTEAAKMKPNLTPESISVEAEKYIEQCKEISDHDLRINCFEGVAQYVERATYLMQHGAEDFCIHYGYCSSRLSRD